MSRVEGKSFKVTTTGAQEVPHQVQQPQYSSGVVSSPSKNPRRLSKEELKKKIEAMREADSQMVTGMFVNKENPGTSLSFRIKLYPGDDFLEYWLIDGERYSLPRGVAKHLTNGCYFKEYKHMKGQFGDDGIRVGGADGRLKPHEVMYAQKKVHRFNFQGLEWLDDPEMKQVELTEVSYL